MKRISDKEINEVFGQDMSAVGDWMIDCRAVAQAQLEDCERQVVGMVQKAKIQALKDVVEWFMESYPEVCDEFLEAKLKEWGINDGS